MALTKAHNRMLAGAALSVIDYGATGDGTTDDTVAIQAACSALTAGDVLVFPKGSYLLSDTVTISVQDVTVFAYGATITQSGEFKKSLNFSDAGAARVFGGKFIGKGTEHNGGSTSYNGVAAIYLEEPTGAIIEGVTASNHAGGTFIFKNGNGLTIRDCEITGIGTSGGISPLDNNADFAIGSVNTTAIQNVTVDSCRIKDTCFGIFSTKGSGLFVSNNSFDNTPGQHHIYAAATSNMIVTGNYFGPCAGEAVKNQIAATSDIDTDGIVVSDNVFSSTGQSCVAVGWAAGATVGRHKQVLVQGNVARDIGSYFAVIRRCDRGDVIDNVFQDIDAAALDLQDWRGQVSGNTIKNGEWYAINATVNGNCEFFDNSITDVALNVAGDTSTLRYQVMAFISAFSGSGHRVEWRNNTLEMNSSPTHLTYALRSDSAVSIVLDGGVNVSGKPHLLQGLIYNDGQYSPSVDNANSATLNPTTPIYGRGKRHLYGTQDPASASMTDTFRQGDICWNTTPSAGGTVGWVCTSSGTPGTWKSFGAISI